VPVDASRRLLCRLSSLRRKASITSSASPSGRPRPRPRPRANLSLCVTRVDEVGDVVAVVWDCDVVGDVDSDVEFGEVEVEVAEVEVGVVIIEVDSSAAN
jgi:hypothetical protein